MRFITLTGILVLTFNFISLTSAAGCYNVNCKVNPCTLFDAQQQCSNHANAECKPNYCNGCIAEFWENGQKLTDCFDITVLG